MGIKEELEKIEELKKFKLGLLHIFLKHTSASICICESWDSDVLVDMEVILNRLIPENLNYKHISEGSDDMPGHGKNILVGCQLTIPIKDGKLNMGKWQGIWLCEHRNRLTSRMLVLTLQGF